MNVSCSAAATNNAKKVHHVFRTPRWAFPSSLFGVHSTRALFARLGSSMMTSWVHPSSVQRFMHAHMPWLVDGFWSLVAAILNHVRSSYAKGALCQQSHILILLNEPPTRKNTSVFFSRRTNSSANSFVAAQAVCIFDSRSSAKRLSYTNTMQVRCD